MSCLLICIIRLSCYPLLFRIDNKQAVYLVALAEVMTTAMYIHLFRYLLFFSFDNKKFTGSILERTRPGLRNKNKKSSPQF